MRWIRMRVSLATSSRASVSAGWMSVWPMTSRIALSATALMVSSGSRTLKRY